MHTRRRNGILIDTTQVTVIGGGLAGCEAALQLAQRGIKVLLFEMRPKVKAPAHHGSGLAELVCSNSFKSEDPHTAAGLLKQELSMMGSCLLTYAKQAKVPAGSALAVDRDQFSSLVSRAIESEPNITLIREEIRSIPTTGPVIIATGPLTSPAFEQALGGLVPEKQIEFYDAAAPIVDALSLDESILFRQSRYAKGESADYLNAPFSKEEYENFISELISAKRSTLKEFETKDLFQACQPIEEVARKGVDAVRFGALKPVGLIDPRTNERPWAVVQLRSENQQNTMYNLVGFQTNLTFSEQERVFRMIPGLEHASFFRFGVMHKNTFLDAPRILTDTFSLKSDPRIRFAGQVTGTEGYTEAIASGLFVAVNVFAELKGLSPLMLPKTSALGSLVSYATNPQTNPYQPMHVNYGLVPPLESRVRGKKERYAAYASRAREDLEKVLVSRTDLQLSGI